MPGSRCDRSGLTSDLGLTANWYDSLQEYSGTATQTRFSFRIPVTKSPYDYFEGETTRRQLECTLISKLEAD